MLALRLAPTFPPFHFLHEYADQWVSPFAAYLKALKKHLADSGKPEDEIKTFLKSALDFYTNNVLSSMKDWQFFKGETDHESVGA